jgi:methionine aminopeptidase
MISDLGCHIDGFIAVAAHTFVVGATKVSIYKLLFLSV